ncbi:hypothetical protein [Aeromicrobium sp. P5_D10]
MTFTAFFDDAALFPPGNAPMDAAVRAHVARRATRYGAYVGPFVCPAGRLAELADALGDDRIEVAVTGTPEAAIPAGVKVVAVELKGPLTELPTLPASVRIFVEQPWGEPVRVPAGAMLKLRCGGEYVPSACQLGHAITQCVDQGLAFKLTAGLHHAVRTDDEHGFLNVLAAVEAALDGDDPVPALLNDDPRALKVRDPAAARQLFRSIGTCSIDEPLTDLRALGWLS